MRLVSTVPTRGWARATTLLAAVAMLMSMMAIYAQPAQAHHPDISARVYCDDDGSLKLYYLSQSWKQDPNADGESGNPDIRIRVSVDGGAYTEIAQGAYTSTNGYEFDGTVDASQWAGHSIVVQSYAEAAFNNGSSPGSHRETGSIDVVDDCYGTIIVKKVVRGVESEQSFPFASSYQEPFQLSDGESNDSGPLRPGEYSVSEDPPTGWNLVSATCDDQSQPSSIDLQLYETVTCTFVNEPTPEPKPGRIIVKKQVNGEETQQTFDFEPSYGEPFSLGDGQENDSGELDPGTYSVSEDVPSGWSLTSSSCVSSLESDQTPGAIELGEGETVTCTFVNERRETPPGGGGGGGGDRGVVRVIKRVVGDDSGTLFTFEGDVGGEIGDGGTLTESAPVDESFTSTETVPAGWQLEGISCVADGGRFTIGSDTVVMSVTEDDGEVTCMFTNKRVDDEVAASILVAVGGSCVVDNAGSGVGVINVTQAVAGGATVVIKSGDTVVATFTEDGSVNVPEGQTYTWEATANAGFEFPADFVPSGAIAIDTCSQETLPFTGVESDRLLGMAVLLLGAGTMLVLSSRRREEG